jgi:hypothetical protein
MYTSVFNYQMGKMPLSSSLSENSPYDRHNLISFFVSQRVHSVDVNTIQGEK